MALGIGNHINMDELVQITGDEVLAFRNDSLDNFIHEFRKLAVGEHCEYAKGRAYCMIGRLSLSSSSRPPPLHVINNLAALCAIRSTILHTVDLINSILVRLCASDLTAVVG